MWVQFYLYQFYLYLSCTRCPVDPLPEGERKKNMTKENANNLARNSGPKRSFFWKPNSSTGPAWHPDHMPSWSHPDLSLQADPGYIISHRAGRARLPPWSHAVRPLLYTKSEIFRWACEDKVVWCSPDTSSTSVTKHIDRRCMSFYSSVLVSLVHNVVKRAIIRLKRRPWSLSTTPGHAFLRDPSLCRRALSLYSPHTELMLFSLLMIFFFSFFFFSLFFLLFLFPLFFLSVFSLYGFFC